ncbi:uncharacterized protein LOC143037324 [Oratosquilla oratoria]|uniref:uncharacterized protein LOC143037324 n=1 Tax=Oratosquilla oratoria TaxID=337810 RepID=UPI003F774870
MEEFKDKRTGESSTWNPNTNLNYEKRTNLNERKVQVNVTQKTRNSCWLCQERHVIDVYSQLRRLTYEERLGKIYNLGICFNCLRKGYKSSQYRAVRICEQCGGSHLTIMHRSKENSKNEGEDTTVNAVVTNHFDDSRVQLFASQLKDLVGGTTAIPVQVELNGKVVNTRCYLDNGSSVKFCTGNLLEKLGVTDMNYQPTTLQFSAMIGTKGMSCFNVEGMPVADVEGNNQIRLPPVFAVKKLPLSQSHSIRKSDVEKWEHLRKLEFNHIEGEVEIMVGSNVPEASEPWEVVHAEKVGDPYAVRTRLGWVICGRLTDTAEEVTVNSIKVAGNYLDQKLIESYNREFVDSSLNSIEPSVEDRKWLQFVEFGGKQMTNGKYEIPLPMKEKPIIVPDSEPMAFERLQWLKRKFKDNEYYKQYNQFMINLLDKGHADEVPTCDVKNQQAWYISHFGGPDIRNLLLGALLRFRLGLYAYVADIETMYYQVKVPECNRDYLRFLWWKDGQIGGDVVKLRMTSHLFGTCCSPSIANYALKRVIQDSGGGTHGKASCVKPIETEILGASKVLKEHLVVCQIGIELAKRGVDWVFTIPGVYYYGGIFERMIRAVRRVLEVVLGTQTLSDNSLITSFTLGSQEILC